MKHPPWGSHMRYWVFQNFRVTGPFEADALGRIAGFSAITLVCPDRSSGMDAEDWLRAGSVPGLAAALDPSRRRAPTPPAVRVPEPPAPPATAHPSAFETLRERVRDLEAGAEERRAGEAAKDAEAQGLRAELAAREEELASLRARVEAEPGALEARMRELSEEARALRAASAELREKLLLRDAEVVRLEAADAGSMRRVEELAAKLSALEAERAASSAPGAELEQVREEARAALARVLELRLVLKSLEERAGLAPPEPAPAAAPEAAPAAPAPAPAAQASRRETLLAAAAGGLAGAAVALSLSLSRAPAKAPSEPPPRVAEKTPPPAAPKERAPVPDLQRSTAGAQAAEDPEAPELPSIYAASRRKPPPPGW